MVVSVVFSLVHVDPFNSRTAKKIYSIEITFDESYELEVRLESYLNQMELELIGYRDNFMCNELKNVFADPLLMAWMWASDKSFDGKSPPDIVVRCARANGTILFSVKGAASYPDPQMQRVLLNGLNMATDNRRRSLKNILALVQNFTSDGERNWIIEEVKDKLASSPVPEGFAMDDVRVIEVSRIELTFNEIGSIIVFCIFLTLLLSNIKSVFKPDR